MNAHRTMTAAALGAAALALAVPAVAHAQTTLDPGVPATYCVTVTRDAFDYLGEPAALLEAIRMGDVTITLVESPDACAGSAPVAAEDVLTYEDWVEHVNAAGDDLKSIAKALSSGRLSAQIKGVQRLNAWAKDELRYLDSITPDPCWIDEYDSWQVGAREIKNGTGAFLRAYRSQNLRAVKASVKVVVGGLDLTGEVMDSWKDECVA